jgi:hypothetical protein
VDPVSPPEQPQANDQAPQEQRSQPYRRAALERAQLGGRDLGELAGVQPFSPLERLGSCLAAELDRGTLLDLVPENPLDLRGDPCQVCAGPYGNLDQGAALGRQARRAALHPVDLIQTRQHGREAFRSAGPGWRQSRPRQLEDL